MKKGQENKKKLCVCVCVREKETYKKKWEENARTGQRDEKRNMQSLKRNKEKDEKK